MKTNRPTQTRDLMLLPLIMAVPLAFIVGLTEEWGIGDFMVTWSAIAFGGMMLALVVLGGEG